MDNSKLLNLMRFWLIGLFVIIFTATTAYVSLYADHNWIQAILQSAPIWGITAVLCILWYFIYKWYIRRKS